MKRKQKFKAIIFDWGGVLCNGADYATHPLLIKNPKINKIPKKAIKDFYIGKIDSKQFWVLLLNKVDISINLEELENSYFNSYKIYPGMFRLLKKLRKNYKLGLLSNLTEMMKDHIILKHKVDKYFDQLVFSCDIGYMKPGKKAFNSIIKKMKVPINQTIFVDDTMANIEVANKMGFKSLLFKSEKQFKNDLYKLGIKI